jgi:hypothetical protein
MWIRSTTRRAQLGREAGELGWIIDDNDESRAKVLGDLKRADFLEEEQVQTISRHDNVHNKALGNL